MQGKDNSDNKSPIDNSLHNLKDPTIAVNGEDLNVSVLEGKEEENETTAGDEIVTFDQLIKLDAEREDTALALLGGSLDLVCTYSEGYKNRQPLYSCKTCFEKTGKLAGICYACSENCHEGHDLVEMYSKRCFCCDCGNTKFDTKCKLFEEKDAFNKQNKYNDNFKGIFCSCKKPYPPDENDTQASEEDMIQCCMCEDWFHPTHIFPPDQQSIADEAEKGCSDDVEGLICKDCMTIYSFLAFYTSANGSSDELSNTNQSQSAEEGNDECKLEAMRKKKSNADEEDTSKSVWVKAGWRKELCRCKKCMNIYEDLECTFLLEPEDTIAHFEQQNREKAAQNSEAKDIYQIVVEETKEHETALKLLVGMEHMKDHCVEFFVKRAAEKRGPITGEDVEQCFAELRAKRTKLEEDSQQNDEQLDRPGNGPWTQ